MIFIPISIGVLFLIAFLVFRVKEKRVIAVVFKGVTSLLFIITALVAWILSKHTNNTFGIFVLIGLFFGLLGDIFLDLKYILKKEHLVTVLGFIAFGIGHIFFTTGLFIHFYDFSKNILYLIIPIIVSILLVVVTILMEKFTKIKYKKMTPYVIGYGFILFFVTSIYFSTCIQNGWQIITVNMMFAGFVLFALSDLILNNTYFSTGCNTPLFVITNHVLYYIAQFIIAASLLFLV